MSTVTWNMQGGTDTTESKWTKFVQQLVQKLDVVCLQEAGALPSTAAAVAVGSQPPWTAVPPTGFEWEYATWNIGSTSRPKNVNILWGKTDSGGNRVNLAICSLTEPKALLYAAPGLTAGRPSLGMEISGENIYTLHAFSGGGGDAGGLVTNINAGPAPWFALGDFNRAPTWTLTAGVMCPPNGPTQLSGNKLDYMVKSANPAETGQVQVGGIWSDHFFVSYA